MARSFIHNEDAHSLKFLLPAFGFADGRDFGGWLRQQPDFPHGNALMARMFERRAETLALTPAEQRTLHELLTYAMTPDEGLGCLPRAWRGMYLEALQDYAHYSGEASAVVQLDFRNMANTNDALGRAQVNRLMRAMTEIFARTLEGGNENIRDIHALTDENLPALSRAGVTVLRPGGDEVEFYVTKLSPSALRERMELAHRVVEVFLTDLGTVEDKGNVLARLAYKKDPEDRYKAGFGVGMGSVMLEGEMQPVKQIQDALDRGIATHKVCAGRDRSQQLDDELGGHEGWSPLSAKEVRSMLPAQKVEEVLTRAETILHLGQAKSQTPWPERLPLPEAKEGEGLDLYEARKAALTSFKRNMNEAQQSLTDRLGYLVNTRDPLTGFKAARSLPRSMDYLREHSRHPLVLAEVELSNLVTLNKVLGIDDANALLCAMNNREILPRLQEAFGEAFSPARDIYYAGGSRMRLLLRNIPVEEVNAKLQEISQRIEEEVNHRTLGEVLETLGLPGLKEKVGNLLEKPCTALKHPKKEARSVTHGFEPREGLELLFGAMRVEPKLGSATNISLLEALKETYEEHPMLVHRQMHDHEVFFKQSDCVWAVGNGKQNTGVIHAIPESFEKIIVREHHRLPRPLYLTVMQEMYQTPTTTVDGKSHTVSIDSQQGLGRKRE